MITPELVNYIQLRIAKGHHLDIIRKDLFAYGGWTNDDIDQVFKSVGVSEQDVPMVSMESSAIKTGENKDQIISAQKISYEPKEIQQQSTVNIDLGGNVSVSSEKENISMMPKENVVAQEEISTVLDLDNESLKQAGIESVPDDTVDVLNEKQMNDIAISSSSEEIAGISFENPVKEIEKEETIFPVMETSPVAMPPVQPVDSFDPRVHPAPILVKETLIKESNVQNGMQASTYIPEPTAMSSQMGQEKNNSVSTEKTFGSNITPININPVNTPKPVQNFAQEWYAKSDPVTPVVNTFQSSTNPAQTPPAFGDMAITPDTQIHDDGVVIKKHNPLKRIIGIVVVILVVLFGLGIYAYTQGLFSGFFGSEPIAEESTMVNIPTAEQAFDALKNLFPVNSGMQFSYVASITSDTDIFKSLFSLDDKEEDVVNDIIAPMGDGEEITNKNINSEILLNQPVESLLSIDGWLRNEDKGIQSEGTIILEIPRESESELERIRMKFIIDHEFVYVSFGEASLEVVTILNIQKDVWYRLPVVDSFSGETILPKSIQTVASVVYGTSKGLKSVVLNNPGVLNTIMNLSMYQYPLNVDLFGEDFMDKENDFIRIIKNLLGAISLRESTFIPYGFSGSSILDTMSVQHTLSLVSLSDNLINSVIPENVLILFPEIKSVVVENENMQIEDNNTSSSFETIL